MKSKMKSLSEFTLSQNEMKKTNGGRPPYKEADVVHLPSLSVGTYVDGMSYGTDGYLD